MTTQKLVLRLNELSAKDELTDGEQGEMRELFAEYPKLEEAAARGDDADSRSERIAAQKNGPPLPRPVEIERADARRARRCPSSTTKEARNDKRAKARSPALGDSASP